LRCSAAAAAAAAALTLMGCQQLLLLLLLHHHQRQCVRGAWHHPKQLVPSEHRLLQCHYVLHHCAAAWLLQAWQQLLLLLSFCGAGAS
jgi:hypothetical protein